MQVSKLIFLTSNINRRNTISDIIKSKKIKKDKLEKNKQSMSQKQTPLRIK